MPVDLAALGLSPQDIECLTAPIPDGALDLLPSGEVYPQPMYCRKRLLDAFGPGGWGLRPRGDSLEAAARGCQEYDFFVGEQFVATVMARSVRVPEHPDPSLPTIAEIIHDDAVVRACQHLGVGRECADDAFRERFQRDHGVAFRVHGAGSEKPRIRWRRTGGAPIRFTDPETASRERGRRRRAGR